MTIFSNKKSFFSLLLLGSGSTQIMFQFLLQIPLIFLPVLLNQLPGGAALSLPALRLGTGV